MEPGKLVRLLLIGMGACVIMIGLALASTKSNYVQVSSMRSAQEFPTPGLDGQNLPIYPGAKQVEVSAEMAGPDRTAFETADSANAVVDYYERALLGKGWTVFRRWGSNSIDFAWQDSELTMPYSIHAEVSTGGEAPPDEGPTLIHITVGRLPDPNNVPIYQGAQQVERKDMWVTEVIEKAPVDFRERRITFMTGNKPAQVEVYYKDTLPRYGWIWSEGPGPNFTEGATFRFAIGGGDRFLTGGTVNIVAKTGATGQTEVQLRIRATHFRNWSP